MMNGNTKKQQKSILEYIYLLKKKLEKPWNIVLIKMINNGENKDIERFHWRTTLWTRSG